MKEKNNESIDIHSFHWYRDFFKRVFDISFSFIAIVVLGVPMIFIALLIKLNSPQEPILLSKLGLEKTIFHLLF